MNADTARPPVELAERLTKPARYKFDELVQGIALAQQLLRPGPYVLMLWQSVLDFEGLTDWLYLSDACGQMEARRRADLKLRELEAAITSAGNRQPWRRVGGGGGPLAPQTPETTQTSGGPVHLDYGQRLVWRLTATTACGLPRR